MLKKDREAVFDLVSGDLARIGHAVAELNRRPPGHFEDHPISPKLVREQLAAFVQLWESNPVSGCRDWILQFIADAQIADQSVRPLIISALDEDGCQFLPTVIYLMSTKPELFSDVGGQLLRLSTHPDREVRWRIAYFISKVLRPDVGMRKAIDVLATDSDETTQVYIRECRNRSRLGR
jgi:hypothetical protein